MLDLKRQVFCSAVSTLTTPFFEQVLADFVATKRTLLILDSADLRVLQRLRIELDQLYAACSDGAQTRQAPHPGQHVADSGFERRREPALAFVSPIIEAELSVAGLALAA